MGRDGTATRTRILDAAQTLVIARGFSASTVDEIISTAHTTKGAFFNHFPTKQDLARELVQRYADDDAAVLTSLLERAERLSDDPLQQLLLFLGLLADVAEESMREAPGCLLASFCYERELVDDETQELIAEALRRWGRTIRGKLEQIEERYPSRLPVDLDAVADQAATTIEGSYVMVRALGDPALARGQLDQLRAYLTLLFSA